MILYIIFKTTDGSFSGFYDDIDPVQTVISNEPNLSYCRITESFRDQLLGKNLRKMRLILNNIISEKYIVSSYDDVLFETSETKSIDFKKINFIK